jgi:hypothetical protein
VPKLFSLGPLQQNALGEVHSLVELSDFLPESINLSQQLGILGWLGPSAQTVGQRSSDRAE